MPDSSDHDGTMPFDDRRFRDVLGHLPTGVVAITGVDDDGIPAGFIVGTFVSVSLDPPLVAFFVTKESTSFRRIRATGSFCANILSARQEPLCRSLAARGGDKFADIEWHQSGSGSAIIDGAVAWVDCHIESISEAGDHEIVIGRVSDLGISAPTIPLLFFQGGFGGFAPMALVMEARDDLFERLRVVDRVRKGMETLALELGADCLAHAVSGGNIVVVAAAYAPRDSTTYPRVGFQIPLLPPFAEPFLAWAPAHEREAWLDQLRGRADHDPDRIGENIREIVEAGWAYTVRTDVEHDDRPLEDLVRFGLTPAIERELADLVRTRGEHGHPAALDELEPGAARTLCAPILDVDGHLTIMLALHNLPQDLPASEARHYLSRLLALTESVSPVQ